MSNDLALPSGKDVLGYAYQMGAEARANGRKYMSKADRDDIAHYGGFHSWPKIPSGMKNEVMDRWLSGWNAE